MLVIGMREVEAAGVSEGVAAIAVLLIIASAQAGIKQCVSHKSRISRKFPAHGVDMSDRSQESQEASNASDDEETKIRRQAYR